jgi:WD40 repeat protein
MTNYRYQVGGSLAIDIPSYVTRKADQELLQALKSGEFCYIFNCRQMGKSSIMVRTRHLLQQQGYRCTTVDLSCIGSENITPLQWYKGVVTDLWRGFHLSSEVHLKSWWQEEKDISFLQRLNHFIEDILLVKFPQDNIVIFIDEIDSILSLNFAVDDFFALIRSCYDRRAINPQYKRLTFAIFGVATPSDLIVDKNRTPFNIGKAIDLQGFKLEEVQPLIKGIEGKVINSKVVIQEILDWTGGQPFLTQKICHLCLLFSIITIFNHEKYRKKTKPLSKDPRMNRSINAINHSINTIHNLRNTINRSYFISRNFEKSWIERLVYKHIIHNWESQDEPQHLRTISNRILRQEQRAGRMLSIYQQLLQGIQVPTDDSREQIELLLSGLVVKDQGYLRVKNRIYQEVFNIEWVEKQFRNLRPYSQTFDAWVASKQTDESRLLRGQALRDAQAWAQGKSLSDLDYQFLAASQELEKRETQKALEAEKQAAMLLAQANYTLRVAQQKAQQTIKQARLGLAITSVAALSLLAMAGWLAQQAASQKQRATKYEIAALVNHSEALFNSNHLLDALIASLKANIKLKQAPEVWAKTKLRTRLESILQQNLYWVRESNRLEGHDEVVRNVKFSPDGKMIASASRDKTIKLWRPNGTTVQTLVGHNAEVTSVAWSPDGKMIASASRDKTIKLWRVEREASLQNGTIVQTLVGHNDEATSVAWSPDGKMIVTGSQDNTIKLWSHEGKELQTLKGHNGWVTCVVWSPDGKMIASTSRDKTIKLWSHEGKELQTLKGHNHTVMSVSFSPDSDVLASGSWDKTIKLWSRKNHSSFKTRPDNILIGHDKGIISVSFSPDGKTLASGSADHRAKLWSRDGREIHTFKGHNDQVMSVSFSPDSKTLATGSQDKTVRLWNRQGKYLNVLSVHKDWVMSVSFSPDGKTLATSSMDKTAKLLSPDGLAVKILKGHTHPVNSVAWSPDGKIATASWDGTLKLWSVDGQQLQTFKGHKDGILSVSFSPDGKIIATGSQDKTVKLWNRDGQELLTLKGQGDCAERTPCGERIWSVAWSPDSKLVASASGDNTVKLWNLNGTQLQTLRGHDDQVTSVAWSPDGKTIATGSMDKTVKLWSREGQELLTLKGHSGRVWGVAWSPDNRIVASASADNTVKLWSRDGTELQTLMGHDSQVRGVSFSPNGLVLASSDITGKVIVWNLERDLQHEALLTYGCDWVRDYLRTNAQIAEEDRHLCDEHD